MCSFFFFLEGSYFTAGVVKTCPGHGFPLVHINVCDPFFFPLLITRQHLAWLRGVSCQHPTISSGADLIRDEWEIAQGCVYYPTRGDFFWHGALSVLLAASALMDSDKNVFIFAPAGTVFFIPPLARRGCRTCRRLPQTHLHRLRLAALSARVQHQSSSLHPSQAPPPRHRLQVSADRHLAYRFLYIFILFFFFFKCPWRIHCSPPLINKQDG